MKVVPIFRPFLAYRKYLFANKILKTSLGIVATLRNEAGEPDSFQIFYADIPIANYYFNPNKNHRPERLLEALGILEKNKHITMKRSSDIFKIIIQCTKEGERAFNEGFYLKEAIKHSWQLIAGIVAAIFGVITAIIKWVL